jgi:hypothetical protein
VAVVDNDHARLPRMARAILNATEEPSSLALQTGTETRSEGRRRVV